MFEMVKVFVTKLEDLGLIPRSHVVGGMSRLTQAVLWPYMCCDVSSSLHACTNTVKTTANEQQPSQPGALAAGGVRMLSQVYAGVLQVRSKKGKRVVRWYAEVVEVWIKARSYEHMKAVLAVSSPVQPRSFFNKHKLPCSLPHRTPSFSTEGHTQDWPKCAFVWPSSAWILLGMVWEEVTLSIENRTSLGLSWAWRVGFHLTPVSKPMDFAYVKTKALCNRNHCSTFD